MALGRFSPAHEGILDPKKDALDHALPHGLLFLDTTLAADEPLHDAWAAHGPAISTKRTLRDWLALDFGPRIGRA